jgi:hypothetical protein
MAYETRDADTAALMADQRRWIAEHGERRIAFSKRLDEAAAVADRFERLIGRRAFAMYERAPFIMDLLAADGCNGNLPLDWQAFLALDDEQFAHDAGGILAHLNRQTGFLDGCFVPRCAKW